MLSAIVGLNVLRAGGVKAAASFELRPRALTLSSTGLESSIAGQRQ
ncbi:MAG: hypothetical protein K2Y23_12565 [Cyanobacteria bacterium]|nr:hypothetical protein [Cyanobacteriota bacterium]